MSYLFPDGSSTELGVLQVGANINVDSSSIISIPQSVATTASVTFNTILASGNLIVGDSVSITGNLTTGGNINANKLFDAGNRVVSSVTPIAGTGISVTGLTAGGPTVGFTINNTGVTSIVAGNNINISSATGVVTISATGAGIDSTIGVSANYTAGATDEYIGVTANPTVVTLPAGVIGKVYTIKNESTSGTTSVTGTGGEKLDNSTTKNLNSYASITVIFRAGKWNII